MIGGEILVEIEERGGVVGEDVLGRAVSEGLCRDVAIWGICAEKKQLPDVCDEADLRNPHLQSLNNEIVKTVRCAEQLKSRAFYSIEGEAGMVWAEATCVDCTVGEREERWAVDVVPHCAAAGNAVVAEAVEERLKKRRSALIFLRGMGSDWCSF
ncbi:uncharacterized protein MONOS_10782 [Monocercomonoides exilis]|uniref:uncharacterized protein n=1 Tax=Monocercomonoides exilis TaxID=2049356 RepID=UPI003559C625|nr:hypothetical protein MONOS_10782 [Monocercomonoides exilis]|eukprot:MONOS_10782.1-p1 / transcript=MONOS_10782.1 / gene=MONOS_10782 / organism=Monocercomonoides_exilis_PA203 / gene_product=unspecified product / transcript_product=unspecified product / location=Mono_scaffold00504:31705-32334(-) / protein_length=155 / sequence_SO=supercontig / SO=protein_coding / is_pseudo=false